MGEMVCSLRSIVILPYVKRGSPEVQSGQDLLLSAFTQKTSFRITFHFLILGQENLSTHRRLMDSYTFQDACHNQYIDD